MCGNQDGWIDRNEDTKGIDGQIEKWIPRE